jgi:hypothetical protein
VLPLLDGDIQSIFVWFVMLCPVLLVLLFFGTLIWRPVVIYGPADYRDERHFVSVITGSFGEAHSGIESGALSPRTPLRDFWKPGGTVDGDNLKRINQWMLSEQIETDSIALFLNSDMYRDARAKAVEDLRLGAQ